MSLNTSLLDSILQRYVKCDTEAADTIRAASFVVKKRNGDTIYSNAAGNLNFDPDSPPFSSDSICFIASLTKLATAVSVMQLVEKGSIGLDDDVGKVIPELSNKEILKGFQENGTPILTKSTKPLTLRNLLTHSSGFCYDYLESAVVKWNAYVGRTIDSQSYTLKGLYFPLIFEPGDGWMYGIGTDWAGQVVEAISNRTLEDYMQHHIFVPLGMESTTFFIAKQAELARRRAAFCIRESTDLPLALFPDPAPLDADMARGGSGLYSCANDYIKLMGALMTDDSTILKAESIKELFRPQLDDTGHIQAYFDAYNDFTCPEIPMALPINHALGGVVNLQDVPEKRRKGSMTWSGSTGPRWFIDLEMGIAATLFTQTVPFEDEVACKLYDELEKAIYKTFKSE